MYPNKETEISYVYLEKVIRHLDEPICLLGGWAVYFTVNYFFKKEKGYPYIGSRDIDLGFDNVETIKKVMTKLTELDFKKISFRFFKELHSETMKELTKEEAKRTPLHYIFPMYVDLIISKTEPSIKSKLGFMPIDEPLLKYAFDNKEYRKEIEEFGKKIIIPVPSLLLAMKIGSIKGRDKEHKKIKDLCDLTALCLYSGIEIEKIKQELIMLTTKTRIKNNLRTVNKEDIKNVAQILNFQESIISDLIDKLRN